MVFHGRALAGAVKEIQLRSFFFNFSISSPVCFVVDFLKKSFIFYFIGTFRHT